MKEIKLVNSELTAKIDDEDFELVSKYSWNLSSNGYARTTVCYNGFRKTLFLHRLVLNTNEQGYVDHINRNKLDNRRHNLRIVDASENRRNSKINSNSTTGASQIHFERSKFRARVHWQGKRHYVGNFDTLEEAIEARDSYYVKLTQGDIKTLPNILSDLL